MAKRLRTDSEGNVVINKEFFVIIIALIPLFSVLAGAVSYKVTVENEIYNHEIRLMSCEDQIDSVQGSIQQIVISLARIETTQTNIQEDIRDIKEVLNK